MPDAARPNVILIVSDDHGYADRSALGRRDDVATPALDRLAAQGVSCTEPYVTAPVSPSVSPRTATPPATSARSTMDRSVPATAPARRTTASPSRTTSSPGCRCPDLGDYVDWYDGVISPNLPDGRAYYAAQLDLMDAEIGRLLDELDARGLADDTIVVHTTDNGGSTCNYGDNARRTTRWIRAATRGGDGTPVSGPDVPDDGRRPTRRRRIHTWRPRRQVASRG